METAPQAPVAAPRPRWAWRLARAAGIAILIVLVSLSLFAWLAGDRLVFLPTAAVPGVWNRALEVNPELREVAFEAADGTPLVSWHMTAPGATRTVLFFHGNGGNISDRIDLLGRFARMDANALIVGYPGYGRSGGRPSEAGLYAAADAAWTWLEKSGVPASRIVIYGESLGGGPAIELAARKPCAGVIIQSAFTSIPDMAQHTIPLFPSHWFMASRIDNLSRIASVAAPKLFFATRRDEVVPFAQTRRLFETASGAKTWVEFDDCGHNDLVLVRARDWKAAVERFLREAAP